MTETQSKLNICTDSDNRVEMQLSPHVAADNQLIGKVPSPEFGGDKESPKLKSRPSTSQRYAMVIPTAPNDVSDSWDGKNLPRVFSQPERIIPKGCPRPQIPPVPPSTARETSSLKIVLKGKNIPKGPGIILSSIEKASKMSTHMMEDGKPPTAPPVTRAGTEISDVFSAAAPIPGTLPLRPALLPCVGNVKSLPLTEKKKKQLKYKVTLKKPKTKLEPIVPEKKAEPIEIKMETELLETNSDRTQSSDMAEAQCAVRMLVQEAEVLTRDETRPPSMKTKVKQKTPSVETKTETPSGPTPRSVDEIIESLWEQVHTETISESDRRIQEIMNRVMSRGMTQKTEIIQEKSGEEGPPSDEVSGKSTPKQEILEEEEKEVEKEEEKETKEEREEKCVPAEHDGEEETNTETEATMTDEGDVCITAAAGPWDIESLEEEDLNKLKMALNLPLHVTKEDILFLKGEQVKRFSHFPPGLEQKINEKQKVEMSFLSSWNYGDIITGGGKSHGQQGKDSTSELNCKHHHFCTVPKEFEIQSPFTHVGWKYHTPNRFLKDFPIKDCRESISHERNSSEERNAEIEENFGETLDDYLSQTEIMFTDIELTIKGNRAPTILNNNIHFWTLSPPKLHILPSIIKQMMCPFYQGSFNPGTYMSFHKRKSLEKKTATEKLLDDLGDKNEEEIEELLKQRFLEQKSESATDLTEYKREQCPDIDITDNFPQEMKHQQSGLSKLLQIEKCHSDSYCIQNKLETSTMLLPSDFESLNTEMKEHKKGISLMIQRQQEMELAQLEKESIQDSEDLNLLMKGKEEDYEEGENIPISDVREYLKNKSPLKRSQSVISIKKNKSKSLKAKSEKNETRSKSVNDALDDKVFPEKKSSPGIFSVMGRLCSDDMVSEKKLLSLPKTCRDIVSACMSEKTSHQDLEDELSIYSGRSKMSKKSEPISCVLPSNMSRIDMSTNDPQKAELNQKIWAEIDILTAQIEKSPDDWIFDTCRRGVLYRKVGELEKSFDDLNKVIELESSYLDAYWHRHFLYILRGDYSSALDDLNYILDRKPDYKIYMALGVLNEHLESPGVALCHFTKAIQFESSNYLAYFYRAKLYETIGNVNHAIGDYIKASEKNPKHTESIKKQAEYFLKMKNWNVAISKYDRLLQIVTDPEAYLYRAEAYIGLKLWKDALCDVSTAIHLGPYLWKAFYLRGCLLKNDSKQVNRALMDFSISLLLNDSEENISSYNHRGILYVHKKCPEQAAADFTSILEFEPSNINALLNVGLIHMRNFFNYTVAILFFTKVIRIDPFHIKAYQFRGQAYTKLFKYQSALRDYIRIIHMEPNNYKYYFFLGSIFLKLNKKDIASYFMKLIANVDSNIEIGMSSELAAVHSYLDNADKSISILEEALKKDPGNFSLMMSLGKSQLQAKQYEKCLNTFQDLKTIMNSKKKKRKWPAMADEVFFNLGLTYMELKDYKKAVKAFNITTAINPSHAPCLYNRGLAKIRLNYVHCVIDFNKALAIDPIYFEVYLSRAAYYAMNKNYTKGILNCNEALKIHKDSVRALLYRGSMKYFIGAYQLAVVDLTKAIEIEGNCALCFFNRAICFEALDEYVKALCDYSVVLLITDDLNYNVFINRGCLYYELEDYENAKEDFRDASKLRCNDHKILHAWGMCLHKLGKLDEAKAMFTDCINVNCQFADVYISRGNIYMDYVGEKETILASYDYQRAIRVKPDDVLARICLGYTLQVLGKFQKAWHQFSEALIIDPSSEEALEGRAAVCLQMGNTYAAFQDLNAAVRINPTAELYNNRGVVNQHMKCLRDAMTDYKHAIELDPEYALAYYNAANIYLHGRFFQQALKYFNEAIRLDPSDECALINRAVTKVMLKDVEGASVDFSQALQMCPYYAHIYFNRGNLYASLQKYDLAEKDFTSALEILPDDPMTIVQRANVRGRMGKKKLAIADYKKAMELKETLRNLH